MMEVFCAIAVIYVVVDLLGSAYLVRRIGGVRATIRQIRYWSQGGFDDDTDTGDDCNCGEC